jgi:hypothetical protein
VPGFARLQTTVDRAILNTFDADDYANGTTSHVYWALLQVARMRHISDAVVFELLSVLPTELYRPLVRGESYLPQVRYSKRPAHRCGCCAGAVVACVSTGPYHCH